MTEHDIAAELRSEMATELTSRILPYWMENAIDRRNGGFVGLIRTDGVPRHYAPKGGVLNARILWTFSAAYRQLRRLVYRGAANRAICSLRVHFLDPEHGGIFWSVECSGAPLDPRKLVSAQAAAVHALSEYHRATGDANALDEAIRIFHLLERNARDEQVGGYHEAFSREWFPVDEARLGAEAANEPGRTSTHLHLIEGYANLFRAWPDEELRSRLAALVELFLCRGHDRDPRRTHLHLDRRRSSGSKAVSFGHDIQAAWLVADAADLLGGPIAQRAEATSLRMADAVLNEGVDGEGGVFNSRDAAGLVDTDKDWWVQAEAIVGFLHAYERSARPEFLGAAWDTWRFVADHVLDRDSGEWHRRVDRYGSPRPGSEKVGPWKCPYHNARACLDVLMRVDRLGPVGTRAAAPV